MFAGTFDRVKGENCCHFDKKENVNLNMNIVNLNMNIKNLNMNLKCQS